ncbi:hypothetical protein BG011_009242 [Mortierella polycephala]|uniref:26S proteasome non-ATPase regulatory subunit 5 n=1 Tax=Mortierella polycephala TaxID=41804 RepID=A0A9P6U6W8_9FUNG|nr:hypothetical protein BG011_009242 [Mortierella polycephala]
MPAVQSNTSGETQSTSMLEETLASFTSLADPLAIDDALLVLEHALQGRTCRVLELLLKEQPYSALVQDPAVSEALMQALLSPSLPVHALGLSQVDKVASEDVTVLRSMLASDVFKAVVDGIGFESISIAERSKQTLLKLRMMEILAEMAAQSQASLVALEQSGLLEPLKNGLQSTDILTRFNIIEILAEFGATTSGSDFLDHSGILSRMSTVVKEEVDQDPLGVSAIVKLYGKLGASEHADFVTLDMKHQILSQLERLMIGDEDYVPSESLKVEAMATLGLIGGNIQNVEWVAQSQCGASFVNLLPSLPRDSKIAWYHSLAQILACSPDPSPATDKIVSDFYSQLEGPGQSPFISRLLASAKSQTVDLAMSALSVMIPLARYPFGVQRMGSQRDVISFLLDRNSELSHSEKVAKHEVIEAMLKTSQETKTILGIDLLTADQVSRLDLNRRQGPFYQRATATVSIQDIAA